MAIAIATGLVCKPVQSAEVEIESRKSAIQSANHGKLSLREE